MKSKISISLLALLALLLAGATTTITAAPGDLDLSFGNGGIVVTSFSGQYYDEARAVRVQPDGKIVVCGQIYDDDGGALGFFLARYHPTGALDASFGTNGKIIASYSTMVGNDIVLQPDGKIITVGYGFLVGNGFAVHRYNANGTLDASFGAGGVVITPFGEYAGASSVALQADGKIVVAGSSDSPPRLNFTVVRLLPDGSLDTSFNGTGQVITSFGNDSAARRVFLQPDGKIVAVGTRFGSYYTSAFALARYNADGSLDSGFGAGGKVVHAVFNGGLWNAALQPDGKIVASGRFAAPPSSNWDIIVRCNPNGSLDTGFAENGVFTAEPNLHIDGIALQPNGKLVAFGSEDGGNSSFAILRLHPNGAPDTGFGADGKVITPIINSSSYAVEGAALPDGKILAFGLTIQPDYSSDIALVRYLGDAPSACPNPIDCPEFFVRQHYLDFLSRDPDARGLAYWANEITQCGADAACLHQRRIGVSAAFFIETEFQETGYFVYRLYRASYGNMPAPNQTRANLTYNEFNSDRANLIGGPNLEQAKQTLVNNWTQRSRFLTAYPLTLSNADFVNRLFDRAGLVGFAAEREAEINAMNTQGRNRAQVVRNVLEQPAVVSREYNPAFVLTQYFGYLRRDPDQAGYDFWLDILNQQPQNFRGMVCAFLTSTEYQRRFGNVVTRTNADCAP